MVHMLSQIEPEARVFTIDTGVLFPETLQTWKEFEGRFGLKVEIFDARSPDVPWTGGAHCCGPAKVAALEQALEGVDGWITGIRREQANTRSEAGEARARRAPGNLEAQPAGGLEREGHLALHPPL